MDNSEMHRSPSQLAAEDNRQRSINSMNQPIPHASDELNDSIIAFCACGSDSTKLKGQEILPDSSFFDVSAYVTS